VEVKKGRDGGHDEKILEGEGGNVEYCVRGEKV